MREINVKDTTTYRLEAPDGKIVIGEGVTLLEPVIIAQDIQVKQPVRILTHECLECEKVDRPELCPKFLDGECTDFPTLGEEDLISSDFIISEGKEQILAPYGTGLPREADVNMRLTYLNERLEKKLKAKTTFQEQIEKIKGKGVDVSGIGKDYHSMVEIEKIRAETELRKKRLEERTKRKKKRLEEKTKRIKAELEASLKASFAKLGMELNDSLLESLYNQGVRNKEDLLQAAKSHKLRGLKELGDEEEKALLKQLQSG